MCGFVVIFDPIGRSGPAERRHARMVKAVEAIHHRGPDDQQHWSEGPVSLGFARLAIVDIASGHQPMCNETGRLWLVFNGEIYNHADLRRELVVAGHRFKTNHSDSEVLLHGWEEWGEALLPRLNGMFAFALWDQDRQHLVVARDRFGIKPLYWAETGGSLVLASEVKAILAAGIVPARRNPQAIAEYLLQQNTWGEQTLFDGVFEFPKAQVWQWRSSHTGAVLTRKQVFWRALHVRNTQLSYADAVAQHRHLLRKAVKRQMMADVPVMTYLSGGIDSSSIAALAAMERPDVAAYACLFDLTHVGDDRIVDEREFSRAAASHLGLPLHELELSPTALIDGLDTTVRAIESPRMGMAYVNYLIAKRVARDGKVVLSGTGGDEYHGGYIGRYQYVEAQCQHALAAQAQLSIRHWLWRLFRRHGAPVPTTHVPTVPWTEHYRIMLSFPLRADQVTEALDDDFLAQANWQRIEADWVQRLAAVEPLGPSAGVLAMDAETYLHGLLVVEDKLSMANSLEARVPLLDNELVDFTLTLPMDYLVKGDAGKRLFRDSVAPWLPDVIANKPKMGFGPPDASWYRQQLRPFVSDRLAPDEVARDGVFKPQWLQARLQEHMAATHNHIPLLWSALSLGAWHRSFGV